MAKSQAPRWKLRLSSFQNALASLEQGALLHPELNELEVDGLIQRYEFTFELAWKTLQDLLKETGYIGLPGPKNILKQAFQDGYLADGHLWMDMLDARNELTHLYDERKSRVNAERITEEFLPALHALNKKLSAI